MAKHLAQIHGTEEDKVNCPFYFKIGCCRHGERCSRIHHKPAFSQTLLIKHLYQHPVRLAELQQASTGQKPAIDESKALEDFLVFFEDLHTELSKFGTVQDLHIVDNVGDHMIGHVYVKYSDEEQASDALVGLQNRYYDGRLIQAEFSPVTDFNEARCRDYDELACSRAGYCNFLHVKPVPECLIRSLDDDANEARHLREEQDRRDKKKRRSGRDKDRDRSDRKSHKRSKHQSHSRSRSHSEGSY